MNNDKQIIFNHNGFIKLQLSVSGKSFLRAKVFCVEISYQCLAIHYQ